ncbi:hypothetical protein Zmor_020641 [Zophobas morio]|uniref:Uncharacterized protein n=1 Tax=Zophobas morio TaxID=2755281 RepID=A0AA38I4B8_9CUCU|nr:hypothetical protein Zmor_020641 [Zophobas morio]
MHNPYKAAKPYRCKRQCGEVLAMAMRRAAKGNWRIHCSLAMHCAPNVVGAAVPNFVHPLRPPHCFLRGIPSLHCELLQSHHPVYSYHPGTKQTTLKFNVGLRTPSKISNTSLSNPTETFLDLDELVYVGR